MTFVEKVCVLGAGSTKYGKLADSIADITTQASVAAIKSAGIEPKDIKASYISNVFGVADKQVHIGPVLMSRLGIPDKPSLTIESACEVALFHLEKHMQMLQQDFMIVF